MDIESIETRRTDELVKLFTDRDVKFAVISVDRADNTEQQNKKLQADLRADIRAAGLGCREYIARWKEQGNYIERVSFLIPGIGRKHACRLGAKYDQAAVFYKDSEVPLRKELVKAIFAGTGSQKNCEEFELYERYLINTRLGFTQYRITLDRKAGSYEDQ